jgi:hypothetical protein
MANNPPRVDVPMPVAGTFTNLFVPFNAAVGGSASYQFLVRDATTNTNTALQCAITDPAIARSDTTGTAAFPQGDLFEIRVVVTGAPTTGPNLTWSLQYH